MIPVEVTLKIDKAEFFAMVVFITDVSSLVIDDLKVNPGKMETSKYVVYDYFVAKIYSKSTIAVWERKEPNRFYSLKIPLGIARSINEELQKIELTHHEWNLFKFRNQLENRLNEIFVPSSLKIIKI